MNQIKQFNKVLGKLIKAIRQAEVKTVVEITVTNRSMYILISIYYDDLFLGLYVKKNFKIRSSILKTLPD